MSGLDDLAFEKACLAFRLGPPGVLRIVRQRDSAPPDYEPLPTTPADERQAIADAINAYMRELSG